MFKLLKWLKSQNCMFQCQNEYYKTSSRPLLLSSTTSILSGIVCVCFMHDRWWPSIANLDWTCFFFVSERNNASVGQGQPSNMETVAQWKERFCCLLVLGKFRWFIFMNVMDLCNDSFNLNLKSRKIHESWKRFLYLERFTRTSFRWDRANSIFWKSYNSKDP